jgi:hypothetical protein
VHPSCCSWRTVLVLTALPIGSHALASWPEGRQRVQTWMPLCDLMTVVCQYSFRSSRCPRHLSFRCAVHARTSTAVQQSAAVMMATTNAVRQRDLRFHCAVCAHLKCAHSAAVDNAMPDLRCCLFCVVA